MFLINPHLEHKTSKNELIHTLKNRCKLQQMFLINPHLGAPNLECRLDDKNPTFGLVDENPIFRLDDNMIPNQVTFS